MPRLYQAFPLVALLLVASTASAFTPDAAFKMKTLLGTTQPVKTSAPTEYNTNRGIVVLPNAGSRNTQLSLIGQENIRKSITVPPAYEDYMAVRRNALLRLIQRD